MSNKHAVVLFSVLFYSLPANWFCYLNKKMELKISCVSVWGKFFEAKEKFRGVQKKA